MPWTHSDTHRVFPPLFLYGAAGHAGPVLREEGSVIKDTAVFYGIVFLQKILLCRILISAHSELLVFVLKYPALQSAV